MAKLPINKNFPLVRGDTFICPLKFVYKDSQGLIQPVDLTGIGFLFTVFDGLRHTKILTDSSIPGNSAVITNNICTVTIKDTLKIKRHCFYKLTATLPNTFNKTLLSGILEISY